jgi:hypothetical protein
MPIPRDDSRRIRQSKPYYAHLETPTPPRAPDPQSLKNVPDFLKDDFRKPNWNR